MKVVRKHGNEYHWKLLPRWIEEIQCGIEGVTGHCCRLHLRGEIILTTGNLYNLQGRPFNQASI